MAYPTSSTIYKLPFGEKIRVSSSRRFILVRSSATPFDGDAAYIVRRSDSLSRLEHGSEYRRDTDYIIDQADRTVTFYFNGHKEVSKV